MKRLGSLLMVLGAIIGAILGIGIIAGVKVNDTPIMVVVGLAKLTFVSAIGLMGAGAALRRIGVREEQRKLAAPKTPVPNQPSV
jgi:hypothetical protein